MFYEFKERKSVLFIIDQLLSGLSIKPSEEEKNMMCFNWHVALEGINDGQLGAGFKKALKVKLSFMMHQGEFLELCQSSNESGGIEDEASQAWSLVMENLNILKTTIFKNTIISESIREMGGWINLCEKMQTSEEPFRKKEFMGIYQSVKKRSGEFSPLLEGQYPHYRQHIGFKNILEIDEAEKKIKIERETILKIARL